MSEQTYALVTPARNEEDYIEKTLEAVVSQTDRPVRWIVVSDGSTDRTDEIVRKYVQRYDFIRLVRSAEHQERTFGSKALAFRVGYAELDNIPYAFIGNLDADVSFDREYYSHVLAKFAVDPGLGVAGGIRFDLWKGKFSEVESARDSVGGPFQLFRRQCFEAFGGFVPLDMGGVDMVAETKARMHGWRVQSFPELHVYHYRRTGTEKGGLASAWLRDGMKEYRLGYHPLFALARCIQEPFYPESWMRLAGYCWALCCRADKPLPAEFINYLRKEQLGRLWAAASGKSGA